MVLKYAFGVLHSGVVVSTVTTQQRVPGSSYSGSLTSWGLSVWSLCHGYVIANIYREGPKSRLRLRNGRKKLI